MDKDSGFMADVSYQGESNYFTFKSNYQPDQAKKSEPAYSYAPKEPSYSNYPPAPPAPKPAYQDYQEPAAAYYPARQQEYSYAREEPTYQDYPPQSYNYYPPAPQATPDRLYYNAPERTYPAEAPKSQYQPNKYPPQSYRYEEEEVEEPSYAPERTTSRITTTAAPVIVATDPPATEWATETSVAVTTEATPLAAPVMEYGSKPDYSVPMYPLYRADFYSARAKAGKSIPEPQGGYAIDDAGTPYIKPSASYSVPDRLGTYEIKHRKATARKPSQSDYQAPEAIIQSKK